MGQTLSEPVTAKETSSCMNDQVKVGASCMQGWRINMEDAHTHLLSLSEDKDAAFFAPSYQRGDVVDAIKKGFLEVDSDMLKDDAMKDELAGTTAVVVLLKGGRIYCGNLADGSNSTESMATWHCQEPSEIFVFKKNEKKSPEEQIVTAYPDVIVKDLTPDHEFILLACDGIWDVLSNEEVVEFVRARVAAKMEPEQICEELMTRCLAPDCQMGGPRLRQHDRRAGLSAKRGTVRGVGTSLRSAPATMPTFTAREPSGRQGDTAEENKLPQEQQMTEEQTTSPTPPTPPTSTSPLRESGGEMAVA
ncbi:hypothetical protein MRX96_026575 [Rhipicephalus microplus]